MSAIGRMFKPKAPPAAPIAAPEPAPVVEMPDPNSPDVLAAKRRAAEAQLMRSGRRSTILTNANNRGSGADDGYQKTVLG